MANGEPLYPGATEAQQLQLLLKCHPWPAAPAFRHLPAWASAVATSSGPPAAVSWDLAISQLIGASGVQVLEGALQLLPENRSSAAALLSLPYFESASAPATQMPMPKLQIFRKLLVGARGSTPLLHGELSPDLLQFLNHGLPATPFDSANPEAFISEEGQKCEYAGHTGPERLQGLQHLSRKATQPAPAHWRAWITAFIRANEAALRTLQVQLRRQIAKATPEDPDVSGNTEVFEAPIESWVWKYWTLQLMRASEERQDPRHFDGGASLLHFRVLPQEDDRLSKGDRMGEIPGGFPLPLSV